MNTLLTKIIKNPTIYARFLNTLSLLEYIGARKILKSQHHYQIDEKLLAHASEELRHAQVLKRVALKHAPDLCQTYAPEALLCGQEAYEYFQIVDQAVANTLEDNNTWHAYLLTTLLIELRATDFYKIFETVLAQSGQTVFRGILIEEERHLDDMLTCIASVPNHVEKISTLKLIEEQAFAKFLQSVETTLHTEAQHDDRQKEAAL